MRDPLRPGIVRAMGADGPNGPHRPDDPRPWWQRLLRSLRITGAIERDKKTGALGQKVMIKGRLDFCVLIYICAVLVSCAPFAQAIPTGNRADYVDPTRPTPTPTVSEVSQADSRWVFYKDLDGEWRWKHFDTRNGKLIGASSEGYKNRKDCIANAKRHGYRERSPWR